MLLLSLSFVVISVRWCGVGLEPGTLGRNDRRRTRVRVRHDSKQGPSSGTRWEGRRSGFAGSQSRAEQEWKGRRGVGFEPKARGGAARFQTR